MTIQPDRPLADLSDADRAQLLDDLRAEHAGYIDRALQLDLTRGKPASSQLDLSNTLLDRIDEFIAGDGADLRNYGGPAGINEMRQIFADLLAVPVKNVVAGGNSSLELMYDALVAALVHGIGGEPWLQQAAAAGKPIKMIATVPGYDRHFAMAEHLGIELLPVELEEHGPDVDAVAALCADPLVKGMWVVPMYANPDGTCYDEATTRALLRMDAAADFRIWWDNAYVVHHLTDDEPAPLPVLDLAAAEGHPDRVLQFASTSKMTFPGAGVACVSASDADLAWWSDHAAVRTIGPDKLNQWRHVQFFGDADGVRAHMRKHRALVAPKFEAVEETLRRRLGAARVATWTHPRGGYFVSLDVADGTAARVVELAKQAGVVLTPAGSTYPGGHDPRDRNLRLAPTNPGLDEVTQAMEVVATCVLLAAAEQFAAAAS